MHDVFFREMGGFTPGGVQKVLDDIAAGMIDRRRKNNGGRHLR